MGCEHQVFVFNMSALTHVHEVEQNVYMFLGKMHITNLCFQHFIQM